MNHEIKIIFIIFNLVSFLHKKQKKIIKTDNYISLYENNINFSEYSTDIKVIALYLPNINYNSSKNNQNLNYNYTLINSMTIKKYVELAKNHGIYGFAIYYYGIYLNNLLEDPINLLLNDKDIDFHYLLIWSSENNQKYMNEKDKNNFINNIEYKENDYESLIKNIKQYLIDSRYIKINEKPILGIYKPTALSKLKEILLYLRNQAKLLGIGELFFLASIDNKIENFKNYSLFDSIFFLNPNNYDEDKIKDKNYCLYSYLIYKNIEMNNNTFRNISFFRSSILGYDNFSNISFSSYFNYYSPEQFYNLNKIIIEWTKRNYNKENRFIFINAWNNFNKGNYLEPDEKYGYASINSLSKAIFNLSYKEINNLKNYNLTNKIAVQVHMYYVDLINEIIEKINNIPIKFDLFISTDSEIKKNIIENNIKNNSKANIYQIKIFSNKGRDVLPFIIQINPIIKRYKYICHIHTKKSFHNKLGDEWRKYNLFNLLGNNLIVSEILSDFENFYKLGLIFPETFYKIFIYFGDETRQANMKYLNYLIKRLSSDYKIIDRIFDFPIGNMFWARVSAIYQIFNINIDNKFPKESGQLDSTLMHGIERIWVFLAKINGFFYKKIFKHF